MPKQEFALLELFDKFIIESKNGKRLQKNGKRINPRTVEQYEYLKGLLAKFEESKQFPLRIRLLQKPTKRVFEVEKNYWKRFYHKFLDFLYQDLDCYDNYVGSAVKMLRVFFNYLSETKGMPIGTSYKQFYVPKEDISIVVLSPEQLNYLIYDKAFEQGLSADMQVVKDIFVFGCTVALRFSDLIQLQIPNLEFINERWYLKVTSQKTQTFTRVLLPEYARDIVLKYNKKHKTLLPAFSKNYLNQKVKQLIELAGWVHPVAKTRNKRGIPVIVYKEKHKLHRFCDMVTTHTMRRTAITTMLSLGMPEFMVRKISGHAPNSREFFRYVALAQSYMDTELTIVYDKLTNKTLQTSLELKTISDHLMAG
ncbi:tyrosine-type recombinase/integrase [Xanthocytophaga flava]|uniref:tyrosine-type recombinase/integrase n=1 Tax=Xanthocytophaga flava TaxID=3048013 RepID=UPI0028D591E3|nr:tyrosine-type recombinase/integrase [Xanthocytophaga flavus]MDJ1473611.1 tyrosine-type recombinase/integrase [Xanthocytophaga flavus]